MSGYSIYLLSGMVAVIVLTCVTGLRILPIPPSAVLRSYILVRSILGQIFACTIVWMLHRQLALGIYLLLSCVYELLLLAYYVHFHFIPSLKLVIAIRHEAFEVGRELLTGGFLFLETCLIMIYAGIFLALHILYGNQQGLYLDALLRSTAPLTGTGLILLFGFGIFWSVKSGQVSMGHVFSYHNMLKWFGPFCWQASYSFFPPNNNAYLSPLNSVRITGIADRPRDLIFIQLESVGSPMVFARNKDRAIMPNLQRLALEGLFWPEVVSAKGRGGTSDVELAMFTGRIHTSSDAPILDEFYDYSSSIFPPLKDRGYAAFAFHGNSGAFYKRDYAFRKMGAEFYDQKRMSLPDAGWGAADGDVLRFVEKRLAVEHGPVVAAVILMTSHTPFSNILAIDRQAQGDLYQRYCHSLSYVDREVASFIERYRQKSPEAVFVIYGDHGARIPGHPVNKADVVEGTKRDFVPGLIVGPTRAKLIDKNITMPDLAAVAISLAINGEITVGSHCAEGAWDVLRESNRTDSRDNGAAARQTG